LVDPGNENYSTKTENVQMEVPDEAKMKESSLYPDLASVDV
jgi:hypothetical protein